METLHFIHIGTDAEIIFEAKQPTPVLPWPVPRVGERVSVIGMQAGLERHLIGVVERVEWLYGSKCNGPTVAVFLR